MDPRAIFTLNFIQMLLMFGGVISSTSTLLYDIIYIYMISYIYMIIYIYIYDIMYIYIYMYIHHLTSYWTCIFSILFLRGFTNEAIPSRSGHSSSTPWTSFSWTTCSRWFFARTKTHCSIGKSNWSMIKNDHEDFPASHLDFCVSWLL